MCVCVCVSERERQRERKKRGRLKDFVSIDDCITSNDVIDD